MSYAPMSTSGSSEYSPSTRYSVSASNYQQQPAELKVNIASPIVAQLLYELSNKPSRCHGFLYGSSRLRSKRAVSDAQDAGDVNECIVNIERVVISQQWLFDDHRRLRFDVGIERDGQWPLGWLCFDRLMDPGAVSGAYSEETGRWVGRLPAGQHHSPLLMLLAFERAVGDEFRPEMSQIKLRLHRFDRQSEQLRPVALRVRNVGDTSHAEYSEVVERAAGGHAAASTSYSGAHDDHESVLAAELLNAALRLDTEWRGKLAVASDSSERVRSYLSPPMPLVAATSRDSSTAANLVNLSLSDSPNSQSSVRKAFLQTPLTSKILPPSIAAASTVPVGGSSLFLLNPADAGNQHVTVRASQKREKQLHDTSCSNSDEADFGAGVGVPSVVSAPAAQPPPLSALDYAKKKCKNEPPPYQTRQRGAVAGRGILPK